MSCASRQIILTCIRHGETLYNRQKIIQGQLDVPLSEKGQEEARALGRFIKENALRCESSANSLHRLLSIPEVFITSPLSRAKETAVLVRSGAGWESVNLGESDHVREVSFGESEGCSYHAVVGKLVNDGTARELLGISSVEEFHRDSVANWGKLAIFWGEHPGHIAQLLEEEPSRLQPPSRPTMETPSQMQGRARAFIDHLGGLLSDRDLFDPSLPPCQVVLVSHGFFLRVLLSCILSGPNCSTTLPFDLWNTSLSTVRFNLTRDNEGAFRSQDPHLLQLNTTPHLL